MKTEYWILLAIAAAGGYYLYTKSAAASTATGTSGTNLAVGTPVTLTQAFNGYPVGTTYWVAAQSTSAPAGTVTVQDSSGASWNIPSTSLQASAAAPASIGTGGSMSSGFGAGAFGPVRRIG
jgi:hypothetical protein